MTTRFAEPMSRLIEELRKLPGIGTKSAQRLAFHILRSSDEDARALAHSIEQLKQHLRLCGICNNITDIDPCTFCSSPTRNQRLVCVLEEPTNIATIEKTRAYNGVFHILHGTLSPVNGVGPEQLRIANLLTRATALAADASTDPAEIILATSPTTEGEATANYIAHELHRISRDGSHPALRITRIATGVPAGSDIEYADEVTISRAMEHRRAL
jgi:recombination protein RecR